MANENAKIGAVTKEQGDAQAEQASDFVNLVVLNECGGFRAIQDAIHDALLVGNGILRWFVDERGTVKVEAVPPEEWLIHSDATGRSAGIT